MSVCGKEDNIIRHIIPAVNCDGMGYWRYCHIRINFWKTISLSYEIVEKVSNIYCTDKGWTTVEDFHNVTFNPREIIICSFLNF